MQYNEGTEEIKKVRNIQYTAAGMADYSDESFHIAAAFQFTGAKGVLATMWAIHDKDGASQRKSINGRKNLVAKCLKCSGFKSATVMQSSKRTVGQTIST
jgi:hypothetical protein